jgi:hypothetical protein
MPKAKTIVTAERDAESRGCKKPPSSFDVRQVVGSVSCEADWLFRFRHVGGSLKVIVKRVVPHGLHHFIKTTVDGSACYQPCILPKYTLFALTGMARISSFFSSWTWGLFRILAIISPFEKLCWVEFVCGTRSPRNTRLAFPGRSRFSIFDQVGHVLKHGISAYYDGANELANRWPISPFANRIGKKLAPIPPVVQPHSFVRGVKMTLGLPHGSVRNMRLPP